MLCQIKLAVVYANLMRSIWRIQNGDSCHKGLEVVEFARGLSVITRYQMTQPSI